MGVGDEEMMGMCKLARGTTTTPQDGGLLETVRNSLHSRRGPLLDERIRPDLPRTWRFVVARRLRTSADEDDRAAPIKLISGRSSVEPGNLPGSQIAR
jgi:hypothetical protein